MFRFSHALYFAGFMAGVLLLSAWLKQVYGEAGALATAFFAALVEVHAAVASIGQLVAQAQMDMAAAERTLLAVLAASVLARTAVAFVSGGAAYGSRVGIGLALAWLGALLGSGLLALV